MNELGTHILLIDCQDSQGLIYSVTKKLVDYSCNITSNDEYVDKSNNHFYMRTEFSGNISEPELMHELSKSLPTGSNIKLMLKQKKKIVVMATKEHHCLADILLKNHFNELNAEILCVIANHNNLQDLVEKFNIPFCCISHKNLSREEHDELLIEKIKTFSPDYIILAKYMRILSPKFVETFKGLIINIHHSFLPAFIGANPYLQAYERGVKIIGATGHFVTNDLDEGPIIAQSVIEINHTLSVEGIINRGREIEKSVLNKSMRLAFEDRIFVCDNKTIIFE